MEPNELELYIKSYFGIIQPKELEAVCKLFKPTFLEKDAYFLKTGSSSNQLSFIQSGILRIYQNNGNKEITQWISTKGYFVTDLSSFVFNTPARWTIQALEKTTLYTINKEQYRNIGEIIPKWHELEKLFIAKCFAMLEDRIFSHLSMSAKERYKLFFDNNKALFNQVPLQYIASMLGMTPETFSRIRKNNEL